jgi:hypothetical protein
MIRRYVWWWFTCRDRSKPSGRAWAKQFGVSHLASKATSEFKANPNLVRRIEAYGDPKFDQWNRAQACTQRMSARGELRPRSNRKAR